MSAVFASMSILPAYARSISLSPPNGPVATVVSVTGSGFSTSDTSCSITSSKSGLVTAAGCAIASGTVTGTFTVGPGIGPGTYTVTVTGDQVSDSASSSFTVLQPTITLTPQAGPASTFVNVKSGSVKFSPGDTSCTITSPTLVLASTACSMVNGAVTGQFQVSGAAVAGAYEIDVTGTPSLAKASAIFTVTAGSVVMSVTPTDGPINTKISVQGSGFSSIDTSCQITATPDSTTIAASPAPTCSISSGVVTGTFYVGKDALVSTPETITVSASPGGDSASVAFTIDASPQLVFNPSALETPGTTITLTLAPGTQFSSGDVLASCTISSTPGGLFSSSACKISAAGTDLTGTFFTVANVPYGKSYTVTVKGNLGDSASAVFTVASPVAPTVALIPSDAPAGTKVTVQGTGFSGTDTACYISSGPTNIVTSQTCSVSGTTGKITGSFTVATGATPGPFTITVTGSSGDLATAPFTVDGTPILQFTPPSPQGPGTTVVVTLVSGQFSTGDTSCTITSVPSGLFTSSACYISGGTLYGTFFIVSAVASGGTYTVVVKGNLGDLAVGSFSVLVAPSLTLTPSYGYPTQTVSFVGRGLSSTDTSCSVTSTTGPNGASLIGSSTCSISGGTATGTFVVNSQATADGTWLVTVTGNPVGDTTPAAGFMVVPNITVTPKIGSVSAVVAVSGLGFSSAATTCTLTSAPGTLFAAVPPASCAFIVPGPNGNGHIAGTFTVAAAAPAGTYVVTASDGTFSASTTFTVGTPSAQVVITPNIAGPLQSVGVTGSGFSGNDAGACVISGEPAGSTTSCNISGGIVGGSITLPAAPAPGLYLITVTGSSGDFASNYLGVPVTTGTATTSTSTTTSVTTTTATSITTSVPVSLTTTTFTNTGISTDRSYTLTTTTITGQSTYSISTTTTTTSVITSSTSTTVSTMITTTAIYGQVVSPKLATPSSADGNLFGLLSIMTLLGWVLVRRWAL
jgi:hypothetical protein